MRALQVAAYAVIIALTFTVRPAGAQGTPTLERILFPIFVEPTPGLFGSLWASDLWVHNGNPFYASFAPLAVADWPGIPPNTSMRPPIFPQPVTHQPGTFVWALLTVVEKLRFNLRIYDISQAAISAGTEIPVVRESSFFSGKIVLLNVPSNEQFRSLLRVYQALNRGDTPGRVRVRFYALDQYGRERPPLAEQVLTLTPEGEPFEYVPGYAELPFSSQFAAATRVRIEIDPLTPPMRFWAFVTVTNNDTQQVTIVTPQ